MGLRAGQRTGAGGGHRHRPEPAALPTGRAADRHRMEPCHVDIARRRAADLGRAADLVEGDAHALSYPDACFDTVVGTLSRCAIPDPDKAVAEMTRVLRPGGRLLLLDHVASSTWPVRATQRLLELVTVPQGGEHFLRRPSCTGCGPPV